MPLHLARAPRALPSLPLFFLTALGLLLHPACQPEEEEGCIVGINCGPVITPPTNNTNRPDADDGDSGGEEDAPDPEDMAGDMGDVPEDMGPDAEGDAGDTDLADADPDAVTPDADDMADADDIDASDPDADDLDPDVEDMEGQCERDDQCQPNQFCQRGACVPGCHLDEGCAPGLVCDLDAHRCVTPGCDVDSDCPPAAHCEAERCVPGCHRDAGCDPGLVCELDTHACVDPGCRDDRDCPGLQTCDTNTGLCMPSPICFNADDCASGQVCVRGMCTSDIPECVNSAQCDPGEACVRSQCEAETCRNDSDCLQNRHCRLPDAVCADCTQNSHCPQGEVCDLSSGACALPDDNCSNDEQCPGNQRCDTATGECVERQDQVCDDNADCNGFGTCDVNVGLCVGATCANDMDCVGDRVCQAGTCVGPACANDDREPNDTINRATPAQAGSQTLQLCPNDADIFSAPLNAGDGLAAVILFERRAGLLEIDLLDPAGNVVQTSFANPDGQAAVSLESAPQAATWYIRARHVEGGALPYTLQYIPRVGGICVNDDYEPNNSAQLASPASRGAFINARLCSGDEDWFRLDLPEDRDLRLTITTVEGDGGVGVELYSNPQSAPLLRDNSPQNRKEFTLSRQDGPVRYVRITSANSDTPERYLLENFAQ
jgi:hypothetical protein